MSHLDSYPAKPKKSRAEAYGFVSRRGPSQQEGETDRGAGKEAELTIKVCDPTGSL